MNKETGSPQKPAYDMVKPGEVKECLPDCPFTASEIGILLNTGLIKGFRRSRYTEVSLSSIKRLIDFRKDVIG